MSEGKKKLNALQEHFGTLQHQSPMGSGGGGGVTATDAAGEIFLYFNYYQNNNLSST